MTILGEAELDTFRRRGARAESVPAARATVFRLAEQMLHSDEARRSFEHFRQLDGVTGHLEPKARTWIDLALGRRSFQFEHWNHPCFTVERGQIVEFVMEEEPVFMFYVGIMR